MRVMIIMLFALVACKGTKTCQEPRKVPAVQIESSKPSDVLVLGEPSYCTPCAPSNDDSLLKELSYARNGIDSVIAINDTLAARLLHARLMIENARYYLRIAIKDKSQDKFLKGWMRRALEVE